MALSSRTLQLTEALISRRSVTPDDGGCQALIGSRLKPLGFECETLMYGPDRRAGHEPVGGAARLVGRRQVAGLRRPHRRGADRPARTVAQRPVRAHAPRRPPVRPRRRRHEDLDRGDGGRGRRVRRRAAGAPRLDRASCSPATKKARRSTARSRSANGCSARGERLDYCIVGEPTSVDALGDMIKNGRRGTLSGKLTVKGVQGHIAYPHLAKNPIHLFAPALAELVATRWDEGNAYFPADELADVEHPRRHRREQRDPGRAGGRLQLPLLDRVDARVAERRACRPLLDRHGLQYELAWTLGGEPFLTPIGALSEALSQAILRADRREDRTLDHRRHLRRPLHREDLPAGHRIRPAERQHPQDRRMRGGGQPRPA